MSFCLQTSKTESINSTLHLPHVGVPVEQDLRVGRKRRAPRRHFFPRGAPAVTPSDCTRHPPGVHAASQVWTKIPASVQVAHAKESTGLPTTVCMVSKCWAQVKVCNRGSRCMSHPRRMQLSDKGMHGFEPLDRAVWIIVGVVLCGFGEGRNGSSRHFSTFVVPAGLRQSTAKETVLARVGCHTKTKREEDQRGKKMFFRPHRKISRSRTPVVIQPRRNKIAFSPRNTFVIFFARLITEYDKIGFSACFLTEHVTDAMVEVTSFSVVIFAGKL